MCVRLPDETEIRSNGKVHNEEKTSEYAKRRDKMTKTKKQHPRRQNLSRCFCNANVWPHLTNCIHFHKTKTREISTNFSRIKKKNWEYGVISLCWDMVMVIVQLLLSLPQLSMHTFSKENMCAAYVSRHRLVITEPMPLRCKHTHSTNYPIALVSLWVKINFRFARTESKTEREKSVFQVQRQKCTQLRTVCK